MVNPATESHGNHPNTNSITAANPIATTQTQTPSEFPWFEQLVANPHDRLLYLLLIPRRQGILSFLPIVEGRHDQKKPLFLHRYRPEKGWEVRITLDQQGCEPHGNHPNTNPITSHRTTPNPQPPPSSR
jgi:hypothetical protein